MKNTTAILIFTQEISKDMSRKMLTPNKNLGLNRQLFQQLNHHINHVAYETELPVFRSQDLNTSSGTFGEELTNAIQKVFEKGFEKIVCVGNDCPVLDKTQILLAAEQLQSTDTVLGPDQHGGVYLLGVSKKTFDADTFKQLAWKTDKMLESYLTIFTKEYITVINVIADVHTFQDLQTYVSASYFIKFLLQIIEKSSLKVQYFLTYLFDNQLVRYSSLRGPPVY